MIAPKSARRATPLCYASSERLWEHEGGLCEKVLRCGARGVPLRRSALKRFGPKNRRAKSVACGPGASGRRSPNRERGWTSPEGFDLSHHGGSRQTSRSRKDLSKP